MKFVLEQLQILFRFSTTVDNLHQTAGHEAKEMLEYFCDLYLNQPITGSSTDETGAVIGRGGIYHSRFSNFPLFQLALVGSENKMFVSQGATVGRSGDLRN